MSGNTTSAGLHVEQSNLAAAEHSLLPIPFFVLGIFVGTLLIRPEPHHSLTRLSLLVATMLTVGVAASYFAWPGWASILVLNTAMGIMNTSITHVGGESASLGFCDREPEQFGSAPRDGYLARTCRTRAGLVRHILAAGRRVGPYGAPSSWEPCWERHSRLAWPIGPCCCPPSCWWFSLCWKAQRFQASEVAWNWTFSRCQFSKILAETV